jgi:ribosomal protein L32
MSDRSSAPQRLDEVSPYEDPEYPYMNFECPDCGFPLCEWTDCPNCGWYDGAVWEVTMDGYTDCRECGQTIGARNLCDACDRLEVSEA